MNGQHRPLSDSTAAADTPLSAMAAVTRSYGRHCGEPATPTAWHAFRIAHGIAESGADYALGDAFPHDVLLDETGGVGFRKGCYVGQEVVSRMQHRGTARRRVLIVHGRRVPCPPPAPRSPPTDEPVGTLGSIGRQRRACHRPHRPGQGRAGRRPPILAGDVPVTLAIPAWAKFTLSAGRPQRGGSLMAADRAGAPPRAWQRMLSGRRLDLLDPSPLDIEISDIAHGLARVARWNGQTQRRRMPFRLPSIRCWSRRCSATLMPEASADERLAALLHDAPEYVIGDMISPFKSVMGGSYKDCELRLQRAIHLRFSLPAEPAATLRKDDQARRPDRRLFRGDAACRLFDRRGDANSSAGRAASTADRFDFTPRSVTWAQNAFLKRFSAIEKSRHPVATSAVG